MNAMERLLQDDLNRLIDRLAATTREGLLAECGDRRLEIIARLDEAEARLSRRRQDLLSGYAGWLCALEECADVWALAGLAAEVPAARDLQAA